MPTLNEYLGSIVSSITNARMMSDVQTVKVAEEYAKHNLLKHFSIPRMKIADVEMTIPVALEELREKTVAAFEPIDSEKISNIVYSELIKNLSLSRLKSDIRQSVQDKIYRLTLDFEQSLQTTNDLSYLKKYCYEVVSIEKELFQSRDGLKRKIDINELPLHLEKMILPEIKVVNQKKVIEDLNVIVESHRLREQKAENIIYIKLKIREDGMEWDRAEKADGSVESKLLPE